MTFIVSLRPISFRYWLNIIISQPIRMKATLSLTKRSKVNLRNVYRARQLYNNSMLFLFPVIDGKLSTGVNATFNASCYG